ncbi:hypothetical protein EcWSU1_01509 [Enterobacter ludwigii]|uniref:Uncharacterized protein n=1 Tax=Enterobacter ludwigii TaxID=299767 RepID=G8LHQ4_9ENTR|nr:hypothetical protein EcWSU1_01509 [Enterobacter ludwigii]
MRLYLGSVIVNRLPLRRQPGEICLRDAQTHGLIYHDAGDVEVARTRILRQIVAHHEPKIQRHLSGFVDSELFFDHRRKLLTNFVELFIFQIRWQFTGHFFIAQSHLFVAHIQQTIGTGVSQRPWRIEIGLYRLAQTLSKDAVFIHIDRGTDKFMHVTVITDPQVNRLLTPADNTIEFALQIEHQTVNKMQIVMGHGRILDAQQVRLKLIPCGFQRILQFTQRTRGFRQQHFTAGDGRTPVFIQQLRDIVFYLLLLFIHQTLGQIDAVENLCHRIFQRRIDVTVPVEFVTVFIRCIGGALKFTRHNRELHGKTQRGKFTLADVVIGDADTQWRQTIDGVSFRLLAGKAVQQTLTHHIVDCVVGTHANGFAGLLKRITDMAERIHQFTLAHFAIQPFAVQRGNRQQKRESVYRQRDGEIVFPGPGNQFGDCLGKFTHRLSLHLRLVRGDVNIAAKTDKRFLTTIPRF